MYVFQLFTVLPTSAAAPGKCLPAFFTVVLTLCVPGCSSVLLLLLCCCFCVGCVGLGQAKLCPDLGMLTRGARLLFLGFFCCYFTSVHLVFVFLCNICSSHQSPKTRSLDDSEPLHAGKGWEWWPCLPPAPLSGFLLQDNLQHYHRAVTFRAACCCFSLLSDLSWVVTYLGRVLVAPVVPKGHCCYYLDVGPLICWSFQNHGCRA